MVHTIVIELFGKLIIAIFCCSCLRKHTTEKVEEESVNGGDFYLDLSLSQLMEFYKRINLEYAKFSEKVSTKRYKEEVITKVQCERYLARLE